MAPFQENISVFRLFRSTSDIPTEFHRLISPLIRNKPDVIDDQNKKNK